MARRWSELSRRDCAPLLVLLAEGNYLRDLQQVGSADSEIFAMPFSELAQSCKTYAEYG